MDISMHATRASLGIPDEEEGVWVIGSIGCG